MVDDDFLTTLLKMTDLSLIGLDQAMKTLSPIVQQSPTIRDRFGWVQSLPS